MRFLSLALLIFSLSFSAFSQSKKSFKYFNSAREEIRNNNYQKALDDLDKAIADSPDFIEAILFKADLYKEMGQGEKALPLYEQALQNKAPFYVNLFYGEALFNEGEYSKAIEYLKRYAQNPQASQKYMSQANELIENCEFALTATQQPKAYNPQNLGQKVNSKAMEYFPSISADGNTLVFTHRDPNGNPSDEDFWFTIRDSVGADWSKASPLKGSLNTTLNEGAQSITASGNVIFFAACDRPGGQGSCDIYASFLTKEGFWSKPVNLGPNVNTGMWESQPSISSDGKTIYFVRGQNSFAKNIDIYYSTLENGRWSEAQKIPGKVNTLGQETSPYIHFDNQSLYFSSNGHPGMGDLDFFVSRRQEDGTWGEPQNLGYPINTNGQEFSLIVSPDGKTGFFSSDNIAGGFGLLDLYSFELPEESQAVEIAYIKGKVTNKKTGELVDAEIEFSDLDKNKVVLLENSGRDGRYFSVLPGNGDYGLSVQKKGFLFYSKNFSLKTESQERAFELNVELLPIEIGDKVKLENIFFGFDSYEIDEKSFSELATVEHFMKENPTVKISVEGHTDNEGSASHNKTLSENRAKAVYNYLINKGIDASRLSYKGFGDSEPVATNDTEEGRALNRRTEIKITGI